MQRRAELALLLAVTACAPAGRREAVALDEAVDAYRRASDAAKDAQGQKVSEVACTEPAVCDTKQTCVAAIDPTLRATHLKDEVAAAVGDLERHVLDPASPKAEELPGKLSEAKTLLDEARIKMAECDRKLADLKVRFAP